MNWLLKIQVHPKTNILFFKFNVCLVGEKWLSKGEICNIYCRETASAR